MRPPLNAGENVAGVVPSLAPRRASMRPPLNAGENKDRIWAAFKEFLASMRPPLNAGENRRSGAQLHHAVCGFNEAPAERGGEHGAVLWGDAAVAGLQ